MSKAVEPLGNSYFRLSATRIFPAAYARKIRREARREYDVSEKAITNAIFFGVGL